MRMSLGGLDENTFQRARLGTVLPAYLVSRPLSAAEIVLRPVAASSPIISVYQPISTVQFAALLAGTPLFFKGDPAGVSVVLSGNTAVINGSEPYVSGSPYSIARIFATKIYNAAPDKSYAGIVAQTRLVEQAAPKASSSLFGGVLANIVQSVSAVASAPVDLLTGKTPVTLTSVLNAATGPLGLAATGGIGGAAVTQKVGVAMGVTAAVVGGGYLAYSAMAAPAAIAPSTTVASSVAAPTAAATTAAAPAYTTGFLSTTPEAYVGASAAPGTFSTVAASTGVASFPGLAASPIAMGAATGAGFSLSGALATGKAALVTASQIATTVSIGQKLLSPAPSPVKPPTAIQATPAPAPVQPQTTGITSLLNNPVALVALASLFLK